MLTRLIDREHTADMTEEEYVEHLEYLAACMNDLPVGTVLYLNDHKIVKGEWDKEKSVRPDWYDETDDVMCTLTVDHGWKKGICICTDGVNTFREGARAITFLKDMNVVCGERPDGRPMILENGRVCGLVCL